MFEWAKEKERESQIARSLTMMKEKQDNPKMHGRKKRRKGNRREKEKYISNAR